MIIIEVPVVMAAPIVTAIDHAIERGHQTAEAETTVAAGMIHATGGVVEMIRWIPLLGEAMVLVPGAPKTPSRAKMRYASLLRFSGQALGLN